MKKTIRIDVEGVDGAGKTTGIRYISNKLKDLGYKVLETSEVGNPHIPVCVALRDIVLSANHTIPGEAMEFIFSAMRVLNEEYYKQIEHNYDFILSDRGWLSHLAYTNALVSEDFAKKLHINIISKITRLPDIIIYFKIDKGIAHGRLKNRGGKKDAIETRGNEFQDKVRQAYDRYIEELPTSTKVFVIDANDDFTSVQYQLDCVIESLCFAK